MFGSKLSPMGLRIQPLLDKRQWSQSDLARAAGLQRNVVNTAMRGKNVPQPQNLAAIARALGVTKEWLEGQPERPARMALTISSHDPSRARILVDRTVSTTTAAKIAMLLAEDADATQI